MGSLISGGHNNIMGVSLYCNHKFDGSSVGSSDLDVIGVIRNEVNNCA